MRDEIPCNYTAIAALTERAFAPMPFSAGTEAHAIDAMREDGDLMLSLVMTPDYGPVFYSHFGFFNMGDITYRGLSPDPVQLLPFRGEHPKGELTFCRGLEEA